MFTALAFFSAVTVAAVGFGHTPAGRRILSRWGSNERVGMHRQGTPRELAETMNKTRSGSPSRLLELAWIELVPTARQVTMIRNAPSWI